MLKPVITLYNRFPIKDFPLATVYYHSVNTNLKKIINKTPLQVNTKHLNHFRTVLGLSMQSRSLLHTREWLLASSAEVYHKFHKQADPTG